MYSRATTLVLLLTFWLWFFKPNQSFQGLWGLLLYNSPLWSSHTRALLPEREKKKWKHFIISKPLLVINWVLPCYERHNSRLEGGEKFRSSPPDHALNSVLHNLWWCLYTWRLPTKKKNKFKVYAKYWPNISTHVTKMLKSRLYNKDKRFAQVALAFLHLLEFWGYSCVSDKYTTCLTRGKTLQKSQVLYSVERSHHHRWKS